MAPDITELPEKGARNGRMGSRLRRILSRRVTPESSSLGLKGQEVTPVATVVETEKTKAVAIAVTNGVEGASPAGSRDERKDSHGDGDVDRAEDKKKMEDKVEGPDDGGSDAGIVTGNDSGGDSGHDTGNDTGDDSDSTKGVDASGPLPNFWEKAWNSEELGERGRALLQENVIKPAGSGKKSLTTAARTNSQKAVVEVVIKNTKERMASYTARWGSGDDNKTTLGMARSIFTSALTVKEVLDSILQFDPTWYASSAWAVVSFGLKLVQNDKDMMDLTFEACEYLADLMARYARIEVHYRERRAKREKPLERALVSVYVAILVYASEVQASIVAKTWTRIRKSIISLTGQPLEDLKRKIDDQKDKLEEWQKVIDREGAYEAARKLNSIEQDTDELLKKVDELAKDTAKTLHGIKAEELRELWRWLREMEAGSQSKIRKSTESEIAWWKSSGDDQWKLRSRKSKARGKKRSEIVRFEGSDDGDGKKSTKTDEITAWNGSEDDDDDDEVMEKSSEDRGQGDEFGDWLFQTSEYVDWIKYPQGLLWLHGSSGCGKSALCTSIMNNLKDTFEKNTKTKKVFASWHFRSDIDDTKKLNLMLASLLRQLASKCEGFRDEKSHSAFRGYQDEGELPSDTKDLLIYLKRFILKIDRDVFLIFDGIDHVIERQGTRDSDPKLLDIIKSLAHKGYPNLHILVVSRDEKDIRLYFENNMKEILVSVDVKEGLGEALDTLIDRKLEGTAMTAMLKEDPELKEKIKARLGHDKQASFLWASSVLRQVFQYHIAGEVEQALKKIPDNINTRYQTALSKVADKDKDRMKRILLWLMWQKRPLSQAEFVAAAELPGPSVVTEICSRVLVETAKEYIEVAGRWRTLEVFRFTHTSVRNYLEDVFSRISKEPELNKSSKIARFVPRLGEDAHLQITRRCLAVMSACRLDQKTRTNATAKTGSYTDWHHATSDSNDASNDSGASDNDFDANDAVHANTDSDEDGQSTSTGSSAAEGGPPEGPARRYAAEYWFHHYAEIDRKKVSPESLIHLEEVESEICSHVLGDADMMRFWLRTYDPDGGMNETVPSPVYYAIKFNLEEISMRLIARVALLPTDAADRRVALLDQPGAEGTALQLAAHQGDSRVLEELIKHKADVNSEKGPHGTALYASAARGDRDAVDKLLQAGAKPDNEDHGDLGSPLHVAAFQGRDAIVELLLGDGGLDVDHRASPFGTALQAASAARQLSTVKLLLDKGADPNIVDGCLGTAAQAAFTHDEGQLIPRNNVIGEELRSRGAQYLDGHLFWTMAYERATSQGASRPRHARMLGRDTPISRDYTLLLRKGGYPKSRQQLGDRQDLLASVISQWKLPIAVVLVDSDRFSRRLVSRVPFQDQFDAIRRVAPQRELDIQQLCHSDFMYKACFWAGINCILGKLPRLVEVCLERVYRELRQLYRYEYDRDGRHKSASPALPFRWAFEEFEDFEDIPFYRDRYIEDDPDPWSSWSRKYRGNQPDTRAMMSFMDRSDLIAMELMQQRQRQRRQDDMLQTPPLADDTGRDRDGRVGDVRPWVESASGAAVWVTSDVLDLVKHLVGCGDRCARYQQAAEDSAVTGYRKHVEELTFELFSAVIRLALVLEGSMEGYDRYDHKIDFGKLAQKIQLLTTVRLERIKELDAICERGLVPKQVHTNVAVEIGSGLVVDVERIAETIAGQVEQVIGDKLAAVQSNMDSDIQRSIKEEVARLMEETQKHLEQKVLDEVQRKVAETQAVPP